MSYFERFIKQYSKENMPYLDMHQLIRILKSMRNEEKSETDPEKRMLYLKDKQAIIKAIRENFMKNKDLFTSED